MCCKLQLMGVRLVHTTMLHLPEAKSHLSHQSPMEPCQQVPISDLFWDSATCPPLQLGRSHMVAEPNLFVHLQTYQRVYWCCTNCQLKCAAVPVGCFAMYSHTPCGTHCDSRCRTTCCGQQWSRAVQRELYACRRSLAGCHLPLTGTRATAVACLSRQSSACRSIATAILPDTINCTTLFNSTSAHTGQSLLTAESQLSSTDAVSSAPTWHPGSFTTCTWLHTSHHCCSQLKYTARVAPH